MSDDAPKPPEAPKAVDPEARAKAVEAAKAKAAAAKAAGEKTAPAQHGPPADAPAWERPPQPPEWTPGDQDPLVVALRERYPEAVLAARGWEDELDLAIAGERIREVCGSLKGGHGYRYLADLCGADYPEREARFEVVYHLYSHEANRRIRLRVAVAEGDEVPSVTAVWRAANWPEREVYDMFGVRFSGHPDMTRILLWEGFNGHPLRKDFPVEGIDTGCAIYPEYYGDSAGPVAGTGTGWRPPAPPAEEADS
jgi:NADH-quinone oxidoreductase subunit C